MIRRRQQQQPVAAHLTITQSPHRLRPLHLRTRHLHSISDHKGRPFSKQAQQDFLEIIGFQKTLRICSWPLRSQSTHGQFRSGGENELLRSQPRSWLPCELRPGRHTDLAQRAKARSICSWKPSFLEFGR
jgi:hypothetical protein